MSDHDDDAPWEPWRPEVGQRVRVRLSGECPSLHHPHGHWAWVEDGGIGDIVAISMSSYLHGHFYRVSSNPFNPMHRGGSGAAGFIAQFAAIELEPLAPEDGRRGEGE